MWFLGRDLWDPTLGKCGTLVSAPHDNQRCWHGTVFCPSWIYRVLQSSRDCHGSWELPRTRSIWSWTSSWSQWQIIHPTPKGTAIWDWQDEMPRWNNGQGRAVHVLCRNYKQFRAWTWSRDTSWNIVSKQGWGTCCRSRAEIQSLLQINKLGEYMNIGLNTVCWYKYPPEIK